MDYTYSWTPTESLSDPNIFNPVASPTVATTYVCTVSDGSSDITVEIYIAVNC